MHTQVRLLYATSLALHGAAAIAAIGLPTPLGGLIYAVLRGGGAGLAGPLLGVALPHYFGTRRLGRLLGGHAAFLVLGTCAGSLLIGASPLLFGKAVSW